MANVGSGERARNRSNMTYSVLVLIVAAIIVAAIVMVTSNDDEGVAEDKEAQVAATSVAEEVAKSVSFGQPSDGAQVPTSFEVIMRAEGLTIEPVGEVNSDAGHFHILIDEDFIAPGDIIPNDETHRHFGDGSATTTLELEAGSHTLRLQLADGVHTALDGDEYRDEIFVAVVDGAPEQAVRFVTPTDGATVPTSFTVMMAATGFTVEPAGEVNAGAGHFHILINEDFIDAESVIPNDETHRHFGSGVTSTELELEPGTYTLRLQLANGAHVAQGGDSFRAEINITVTDDALQQQVMFVGIGDGDTVSSPVALQWAAAGLIVEPAGRVVRLDRGHLHVLINEDFIEAGEVVPNDETHRHFGGGQLGTELELEPGMYTLRLQMANGAHIALEGDEFRDEIEITVE